MDTDRYGRTVAKVYRDGRDINREMIREGHAWVYRKYLRDPSLLEDERRAREAHAGLWGLPEAHRVPPWEWRQGGTTQPVRPQRVEPSPDSGFTCDAKRYCREMRSCEEARFYLERCGLRRLDGDGDGVCPVNRSAGRQSAPGTAWTVPARKYHRRMAKRAATSHSNPWG